MRPLILAAVLTALLLGTLPAGADSSLVCDGYLISVGATKAEVMLRCGEPMLKENIGTTVPPQRTGGLALVIERWTYDQGEGSFFRMLTFHGSDVVAIETGERH